MNEYINKSRKSRDIKSQKSIDNATRELEKTWEKGLKPIIFALANCLILSGIRILPHEKVIAENNKDLSKLEKIRRTLKDGTGIRTVLGNTILALGYILCGGEITSLNRKGSKRELYVDEKYSKVLLVTFEEVIVGLWNSLSGIIKSGCYGIDVLDKMLGKEIEDKMDEKGKKTVGVFWEVLRENILKVMIALSLIGYGGYKTITLFSNTIEVTELKNQKQFVKNFFTSLSLNEIEDLKSSGKNLQDDRENKYLGKDDIWNKMYDGYEHRKEMIKGMCRMIDSEVVIGEGESAVSMSHLEMIIQKAIETRVPIQVVFLALAESYWNDNAKSSVAYGYWQFTESTAKLYGLIDKNGNDYRGDPVKSTEAAMKHLRDNYNQVSNYARKKGYNLSESDKWIFAFFMYNGSPRLVKEGMDACNGNVNEYSEKQINSENRNYVPRILAIQKVLQSIFEENEYNINRVRIICLDYKTGADLQLKEFKKQSNLLTQKERLEALDLIKKEYEKEYKQGIIPKKYYNKAKHEIKQLKRKEKSQRK